MTPRPALAVLWVALSVGGCGRASHEPALDVQPPCELRGTGRVDMIAVSPDGSQLAVAGSAGILRILRAVDGSEVRQIVIPGESIGAVTFAPDGASVVAASGDGHLRRWNLGDGTLAWDVKRHRWPITGVAFSPDGATLATIALLGDARLQRASDGGVISSFGHDGFGWTIAFSPDGQRLVSTGSRKAPSGASPGDHVPEVIVWTARGTALRTLTEADPAGSVVAISPDSQTLAIASNDTLRLVRLGDGADVLAFQGAPDAPSTLAFTPDGASLIADGREALTIWNTVTGALTRKIAFDDTVMNGLALTPDGSAMFCSVHFQLRGRTETGVYRHQVSDGVREWTVPGLDHVNTLSFSPSGQLLSGHQGPYAVLWNSDGSSSKVEGHSFETAALFLGDGSTMAVRSSDITIKGTNDGKVLHQFWNDTLNMAVSADGSFVAGMLYNDKVVVNQLSTFHMSSFVETDVLSIALSPDGKLVASGLRSGEVVLRHVDDVAAMPVRFGSLAGPIKALAFAPGGEWLATGDHDGQLRLWNLPAGVLQHRLGDQDAEITSVAFSPDGSMVAAGNALGVVKSWSLPDGAAQPTRAAHPTFVTALAFSPDGRKLVSGSNDQTIRTWCLP